MSDRWEGVALMLSSVDSQSDRIVRFVTDEGRMVAAVARHARRSTKRFGARIDPINLSRVTYTLKDERTLATLNDARLERAFTVIRGDLVRLGYASVMAEVLLAVVPDFGVDQTLFPLLLRAWSWLDDPAKQATEDVLLLFELRLLVASGLMPPIEDLQGLPEAARDVLSGWLAGTWFPLDQGHRRAVAIALESRVLEATGRSTLKSRAFLDAIVG